MLYCWCKCRGCTERLRLTVEPPDPWPVASPGWHSGHYTGFISHYPRCVHLHIWCIYISCMIMSGWTLIMIQIYKNPLYAFVLINTRWHSEIWQLLYPDSYPGQISQHDPDNLDIMYTDFWWIISLLFGCQGNVNTNVCDHCEGAAPVWTDGPHF